MPFTRNEATTYNLAFSRRSLSAISSYLWVFYVVFVALSHSTLGTYPKREFLESRPSKGLFYYHNATGNADFHEGGNSYDVMRVMTRDVSLDRDERYPVIQPDYPETMFYYSVGGDIISSSDGSQGQKLEKRLGMRACCASGENDYWKRDLRVKQLSQDEIDYYEKKMVYIIGNNYGSTNTIIKRQDIEMGSLEAGEFIPE